jgi:hypothetical protein
LADGNTQVRDDEEASAMSAFRARLTAPALEIAPDEPDQVLRLSRFREKHPGVIIGDGGFGTWQARIPEPDGETVITRYKLRELTGTSSMS